MAMEEQKLEQAVLCCVSPNVDPAIKKQALDFLEQVKVAKDSWRFCLMYFMNRPEGPNEVKFYTLQVLEDTLRNRAMTLTPEDRVTLRASFTLWMSQEIIKRNSEPQFLRNKMIQLIVLLFSQEYLTTWGSFFDELISYLSNGPLMVDVFLRICLTIEEEIIARYIPRSEQESNLATQIKDKMREGAIDRIVEMWFVILANFHTSHPDLVNMSLNAIGIYASWIEINLIVSERFLAAYHSFLGSEKHRDAACECVNEIILKKMKPEKKLALLEALNLGESLGRIEIEDYSEKLGTLINSVGVILSNVWTEFEAAGDPQSQEYAYKLIEKILPFFNRALVHEDEEISSSVFEFSQCLLALYQKEKKVKGKLSPEKRVALQTQLSILVAKMKYGEDYSFHFPGEDEAFFDEMRKKLKIQVENIAAIDEEMMVEYVSMAVNSTLRNLSKCHFTDAELALRLLFNYADANKGQIRLSKTEKNNDKNLYGMLQLMIESNISSYPHHAVQLEYFENVVRYTKFFETFGEYLEPVLISFLDQRGLHHADPIVRRRVMYLFFRFVKSLKHKLYSSTETILTHIQDLLVLPNSSLTIVRPIKRRISQNSVVSLELESFNDQLQIFEVAGLLISMEQISEENRLKYLMALVPTLVGKMEEIQQSGAYKNDTEDNPIFQTILHHAITAVGSIAKGFPPHSGVVHEWENVFKMAMERTLLVLQVLPNSQILKDAARFLFQRLVSCLGISILPFLPSTTTQLLKNCQPKDLIDFIPVMSQLIYRFQATIYPALNELMGGFLVHIFYFMNQETGKITNETTGAVVNSFDSLQQLELRRAYLSMIFAVMTSTLAGVFTSIENQKHFEMILNSVLIFGMDDDIPLQKTSLNVLQKMVECWAGLPDFNQFIYQRILPLCFQLPLKPNFNPNDGQSYVVLGEISALQKLILQKLGPELLEFLQTRFLPSTGLNPQQIQEYLQALQSLDAKQFNRFYKAVIQSRKP